MFNEFILKINYYHYTGIVKTVLISYSLFQFHVSTKVRKKTKLVDFVLLIVRYKKKVYQHRGQPKL